MRQKKRYMPYAEAPTNDERWRENRPVTYTIKPAPPVEWRCKNPHVNFLLEQYFKGWD